MTDDFKGLSRQSDGATVNAHNQSLIDQGFIDAPGKKEIPESVAYIFDMYKEIRFSKIPPNTLVPRDSITFTDINEFQKMSGAEVFPLEARAILSIDAIFNQSR